MKEDITPELQIELSPVDEVPIRFERLRHYIGVAAAGAYMLTFGPTARRIWGGAAGATTAFMLAPPEEFTVGPLEGDVRFASPIDTRGGTTIDLSIAGSIEIPSHKGPAIQIHLNDIKNVNDPSTLVQDFEQNGSIDEFETSIKDALTTLGLRGALFSIGGAIAAGGISGLMQEKGKRCRAIATTVLGGFAASGAFLGILPGTTFNKEALEDTTYSGAISYVPEFFGGIKDMEEKYQNGLVEISDQYNYLANLRDSILESQDIPDDAIGIALMSDQHCAQAGWQLAGRIIASDPRIKFALSAGDHVDFGTELENQLCFNGIEDIDVPIIAIAANHDDPEVTMNYLESKSVRVLNHDSITVEGISIYGYPDLSHSPSSANEADHGAQEFIEIPEETDILLAARPATAKLYIDEVPAAIYGDSHKQSTEIKGKTLLHNPGALEAGGLRAAEKDPAGRRTMSVLYLDKETRKPIAVIEYDFGEMGQLELSVNTCSVVDRDDNLKIVC